MSLLIAKFVEKSDIQAKTYFNFLKKRTKRNLKFFQYQFWAPVKTLEKQLSNKANYWQTLEQINLTALMFD